MRLLPFGDRGLLAEFATAAEVRSADAALRRSAPHGVVDVVPAARTVLVRIDPRWIALTEAATWMRRTVASGPGDAAADPGPEVVVRVRYDGPDLAAAADAVGLAPAALVAAHTAAHWTSDFVGFAPGFAYLTAPDWAVEVPRRATSRERVPAGSVALAAGFSGVYPRPSPGGWQLIGTTDAVLWDVDRDPPALLAPGSRIRFEATP